MIDDGLVTERGECPAEARYYQLRSGISDCRCGYPFTTRQQSPKPYHAFFVIQQPQNEGSIKLQESGNTQRLVGILNH